MAIMRVMFLAGWPPSCSPRTEVCRVRGTSRFGTLLQIYLALLLPELLLEALYHEEKSIMNQLCLIISPRDH